MVDAFVELFATLQAQEDEMVAAESRLLAAGATEEEIAPVRLVRLQWRATNQAAARALANKRRELAEGA